MFGNKKGLVVYQAAVTKTFFPSL